MAKIIPFKGLRPKKNIAPQMATLPYDVVSVEEARQYKKEPFHFYHVTRSEIDLAENVDVHSSQVYEKAKENLDQLVLDNIMVQDSEPCYHIYELVMDGRSQTGLICGSSCDDYFNGVIKKHEFTRPEKELDRINHIRTTRAQTGIVFLAYRDNENAQSIINDWKAEHIPTYDFTAEDGIRHIFWVMDDYAKVASVTRIFNEEVDATYIADGHHRAASAAKVCTEMRNAGMSVSGDESFNYFITAIFPESQLKIMDYNRVAKDLNGLNNQEFLASLQENFDISEVGKIAYKPKQAHEFGMYLSGTWYKLTAKPTAISNDPIGILDVTILQDKILSKVLDIHDPRTDKRIDFVGGIRGLGELEKRVNEGNMAVAFSCFPVSIQQLFNIADSGNVMPPKSTWFEPKLRDGLVVYLI
ncbi:MAG: DUF1015 domain-containing protein [Bacteroidetes bacterium]|nr:DUF1015 domain-containing protein [Bacteroidota bacterium]MBS1740052.1 DUF1015 domain-containing protein [Bacteroidota bacterium]